MSLMVIGYPLGATIGGTIAAGIAGPARVAHGPVRDYVLGVRVLAGDGLAPVSARASLWATGAMGTAVGLGAYDTAIVLSIVTFATLRIMTNFKTEETQGQTDNDE